MPSSSFVGFAVSPSFLQSASSEGYLSLSESVETWNI